MRRPSPPPEWEGDLDEEEEEEEGEGEEEMDFRRQQGGELVRFPLIKSKTAAVGGGSPFLRRISMVPPT